MKKKLLKSFLLAAGLLVGTSAWADTTVGATDNTTGYLGAKSEAYAINGNGTWTFNFTNYNSGSGSAWNNFLLECNNGTNDEFVVRADNWEVVRGANNDFATTYAGSNLVADLNGAAVAMTVTRNGNMISMSADITPATSTAAYKYTYVFKRASGNLNLYLSVDHNYITIQDATWAASSGTITETEIVNCDFENDETLFTAPSTTNNSTTISNVENTGISSNVLSIYTSDKAQNSKYSYAKYDFSTLVSDAALVKVSFDCWIPKSSCSYNEYISISDAANRADITATSYSSAGAIFNVGNIRSKNGGSTNYDWFGVNSTCIDHDTDPAHLGVWLHVESMVDLVNSKNSYKVMNYARTATYASGYDVTFLSNTAAACSQIDIHKATNNRTTMYIDNLVVTKFVDTSVAPATYTIEYKDTEGEAIKTARVGDTFVGSTYTATDADMATFYSNDGTKKYIYKSGNAENTATASDNVITLVFDTYTKYHYALTKSYGGKTDVVEGDEYSDNTKNVYYPACIKDGDNYYTIAANGTEPTFGYTFSSSDLTKTVTYTLDDDIVYYSEYEDACSGVATYEYFPAKSSCGVSKALNGNNTMTTDMNLAATGVYNITLAGGNRDSGHTFTLNLKMKDSEGNISEDNVISQYFTGSSWNGAMVASNVVIPAGSELYIANDNAGNTARFAGDYIIVRKVENVSVEVSAAGYATYVPSYDLDFSSTTIEAYKVKVSTKGVATLTKVDNVPAGTPVLLFKEGGATENIPVMTGAAAVTDNDLVAGTATTATDGVPTTDGDYTNMILNNVNDKIGFYYAAGQTVATNRAYLHIATSLAPDAASQARRMVMVFADEATGIKTVNDERVTGNGYYNLSGQRMNHPTKGLYIVNGKKIIVK